MDIVQQIKKHAAGFPDRTAFQYAGQRLTYSELDLYSDRLAAYLTLKTPDTRPEIVVYGHKHPYMLVSFIACIKAGLAYCPVDISMPTERVRDILSATAAPFVLSTETLPDLNAGQDTWKMTGEVLTLDTLQQIAEDDRLTADPSRMLSPEDICYIIFTSGSTGKPKGVQIPYGCLCRFAAWGLTLGTTPAEKEGKRFLNQAPFSFDLSVMDLYLSLTSGGTLCVLEKSIQAQYKALFERLKEYQPQVWVSTPSFAEVCLADPGFSGELLPEMELFLFCGERLTNRTAEKLLQRFPKARVMNTYGPTESTVAVTEVEVTPELLEAEDPLPVGTARPGTTLLIVSEEGTPLPDGTPGEIVITGDTLSSGYFHAEELTRKAFRPCTLTDASGNAKTVTGYHTGDEGYLKEGMLFYNGRIDLQIKLHGYRIELSDIENNLLKLGGVEQACVVPSLREGRVNQLHAFVVVKERTEENDRKEAARLKTELGALLPEYMIPRKIHFVSQIPMTPNGKADRRALKEMLG